MEDSKLWWYLILGLIYFLSKFLKKKKPDLPPGEIPEDEADFDQQKEKQPEKKSPSSIEEILRELSEQSEKKKESPKPTPTEPDSIPNRQPEPVEAYSREPRPLPTAMPYTEFSRREMSERNTIDDTIEREKPVFERSSNFAITEEVNETANEIHEIFQEEDGPRKAIILGEILNRRY